MNALLRWIRLLAILAILAASSHSSRSVAAPDRTVAAAQATTLSSAGPGRGIKALQTQGRIDWIVLDPRYSAQEVYETLIVPRMVRIDPQDRLYAYSNARDAIYRIEESGELSLFFSHLGWVFPCFGFDAAGNLWFTTGSRELFKVPRGGSLQRIVSGGVNRHFVFDSRGNVVAVDYSNVQNQDIQIITPDGRMDTFAQGLYIVGHAVGPNDEVLILDGNGQVLEVLPGGQQRLIASGFSFDSGIAVGPDGTVYVMEGAGSVTIVDLQMGHKQKIEWLTNYWVLGWDAVFDSAGHMYIYSGNEGLYKIDLQLETVQQVRNPYGNTTAMTTDTLGNVYLAYGDALPGGTTDVFHVQEGSLVQIGSIPGGVPRGLASPDPGRLYVWIDDPTLPTWIHTFDVQSGEHEPFMIPNVAGPLDSLVVDPSTGFLWWSARYDQVYYLDGDGVTHTVAVPPPNPDNIFVDISADGTVYAIIWEQRTVLPGPGPHRLYRLEENGEWTELADMWTEDPGITWALPVACPDGSVYSIAGLDGTAISPDRTEPVMNALLRLEDDGMMRLIGYDLSMDTKAAICDRSTGDIVATHYYGVLRVMRSEVLFLPVVKWHAN